MPKPIPDEVRLFIANERIRLSIDIDSYKSKNMDHLVSFVRGALHALDRMGACLDKTSFADIVEAQSKALCKARMDYHEEDGFDGNMVADDRRKKGLRLFWHLGQGIEIERIFTRLQLCEEKNG